LPEAAPPHPPPITTASPRPLPLEDLHRPPEPDLGGEGGEEVFAGRVDQGVLFGGSGEPSQVTPLRCAAKHGRDGGGNVALLRPGEGGVQGWPGIIASASETSELR
jgi:hypothetical protein